MKSWFRSRWSVVFATLALAADATAASEPQPAGDPTAAFFGLTNLHTFHLTIAPEEWTKMETFEQPSANQPFGAPGPGGPGGGERPRALGFGGGPQGQPRPPMMGIEFHEGKARLDFEGKAWGTVNVRFKGNSSFNAARNSLKRSLKLDFNDMEQGRSFFGMTKLNLNNGALDPSVMREALAYEVFRRAGVPASRTAFAKVFITVPGKYARAYAGLYTAVEQVDGKFLKQHFGQKNGLLVKPERINGLPYLGEQWSAYQRQFGEKSDAKPKETKRFIAFVRLLNQANDAEFAAQIGSFMDVEPYLRFLAVQAALANLDSPLLTGHNLYLYLNPATDKLFWIPWDLNEAFGGFLGGGTAADMVDLSIHRPFPRGNRLPERVLALAGATQTYDWILRGLLATNLTAQRLGEEMEAVATVIREAVREDQQLTLAQFERHLSANPGPAPTVPFQPRRQGAEAGAGPSPGGRGPGGGGPGMAGSQKPLLRQFVTKRVVSIQQQLDGQREGYVPVQMSRRGGPGPNGPAPGGPGGDLQPPPPRN